MKYIKFVWEKKATVLSFLFSGTQYLEVSQSFVDTLKTKGKTSKDFLRKLSVGENKTIFDFVEINASQFQ